MSEGVTNKQIEKYREQFSADSLTSVAQNSVSNNELPSLALRRDLVQSLDSSFSIKLDDWKVTSQMSSGRCWLFAALNLFRVGAMKKMNISKFSMLTQI